MSLLSNILLRLLAVALLSVACAAVWIVRDTNRSLRAAAEISAARVAAQLAARPSLGSASITPSPIFLDWQSESSVAMILPGVCVEFGSTEQSQRRRCNAWDGLGERAPAWFEAVFERHVDIAEPVSRPVMLRGERRGTVTAWLDPVAAVVQSWQQIRVLLGVAAAMALGICGLAAAAVAHALLPAQQILHGIQGLERGELERRLPKFRVAEFDRIARAFNDLAQALAQTTRERTALTRRLFEVQEEERRMIARELHDEFGQCLTATSALAAGIEQGASGMCSDLAQDAKAISRITAQMMAGIRGALTRLRPPDLDEVGLEASLRMLVGGWNVRGSGTRFLLRVKGDLATVPPQEALNIYRIAQECLTNAARHGRPQRVMVDVSCAEFPGGPVRLVVDDDGGGVPEEVSVGSGFGLLGIRERVAALGGGLSIGSAGGGLRISATIPTRAC